MSMRNRVIGLVVCVLVIALVVGMFDPLFEENDERLYPSSEPVGATDRLANILEVLRTMEGTHLYPQHEDAYRKRGRDIALEMGIIGDGHVEVCFWLEMPLTIDGVAVPLHYFSAFERLRAEMWMLKLQAARESREIETPGPPMSDLYNMPTECLDVEFEGVLT